MKSGAEAIAEICTTFPARNIVTLGHGTPAFVGISVSICPQCGERFSYWPTTHMFKRQHKHRKYYFCKYSCMKAFEETHKPTIDKRIEDCRKRLDYLMAQKELPQEEREIKTGLDRLIERADARLDTALRRKAKEMDG